MSPDFDKLARDVVELDKRTADKPLSTLIAAALREAYRQGYADGIAQFPILTPWALT